jgi:hypothetical protein
MNVSQAFANYLQDLGIATLGQDLLIGRAPDINEKLSDGSRVPDNLWWILTDGGSPIKKNQTGESMKSYQVLVYCRNTDYKTIEDTMFQLEEDINCDGCTQLEGVDTIDIEASVFPIDEDLDSEERKVGLLRATIIVYKECT